MLKPAHLGLVFANRQMLCVDTTLEGNERELILPVGFGSYFSYPPVAQYGQVFLFVFWALQSRWLCRHPPGSN